MSFGSFLASMSFFKTSVKLTIIHVLFLCCYSGEGQWSSEGVTTKILDNGVVQCNSTHLTSFTVIVAINDFEVCTCMSLHEL